MKLKRSSERVLDEWGGNRECLLSEEVFPGAWHADPGSREHSGLSAMGGTVTLPAVLCLEYEIPLLGGGDHVGKIRRHQKQRRTKV